MPKVQVRMTPEELAAMDREAAEQGYDNRSQYARAGLRFARDHRAEWPRGQGRHLVDGHTDGRTDGRVWLGPRSPGEEGGTSGATNAASATA